VGSAIVEVEAGSDNQILDRARDKDLAGSGLRSDPGCDVDREAGDVIGEDFDLTDVEPGADLQPELLDLVADSGRAADRPGRAVERGEESVADDLDLDPAETVERASRAATSPSTRPGRSVSRGPPRAGRS
jgi:hypothetical protein